MTALPLSPAGIVELAWIERSGLVESRHLGAAVVVDASGATLLSLGDTDALVYPRSTLKFAQAVAVQRSGLALEGEELAISAASHTATPAHVAIVERMLARGALTVDALQCPADWPADAASRRAATEKSRLTMNCSGKHAAFLLACVANDWPVETYLEPSHPLQQLILSTVEQLTGEPVRHSGVDGCGAPVHAVGLRGLATAMSRVEADVDGARIAAAIRSHPWVLDTPAIARVIGDLGLVAKNGAEGVFVASTPDGTAVALKMMDGSTRASIAVGLGMLAEAGAVDPARARVIASETADPVLGAGVSVGALHTRWS